MNTNPALFYFHAHNEDMNTQVLVDLVKRVDVLYIEMNGLSHEEAKNQEEKLNNYNSADLIRKSGIILLSNPLISNRHEFLANLTAGTDKKYVFERTSLPDFDYEKESHRSNQAFMDYELNQAIQIKMEFLEKSTEFQEYREITVKEQINAIPKSTLVYFGAGHLSLERKVSISRPTEIHFPYYNYPCFFDVQMEEKFKQSGKIDEELYLRSMAEDMVLNGIHNTTEENIWMFENAIEEEQDKISKEQMLLTHEYAKIFPLDKIIDLRNYINFAQQLRTNPKDAFESFLKSRKLPMPEEVLREINKN